jgi:hypothetical protein
MESNALPGANAIQILVPDATIVLTQAPRPAPARSTATSTSRTR